MMKETDLILPGRKNRPSTHGVTHITIHETGNTRPGADARAHAEYLHSDAAVTDKVSWHYTVDDTRIVQHLPDGEVGWHAGTAEGNRSIGIEICINEGADFSKAVDNAAALTRELLEKYDLPLSAVVQHHHWNGKDCPMNLRAGKGGGWVGFLAKVRSDNGSVYSEAGDLHMVRIPVSRFRLLVWGKSKRTTAIRNYFNAGFFSAGAGGIVPVGNLCCDGVIQSQHTTQAGWIGLHGPTSTLWTDTKGHTQIQILDRLDHIPDLWQAVSGVPVLMGGREVSLSRDIQPQGWTGSSLRATWHGFLAPQGDAVLYMALKTTASSPAAATTELYKRFAPMGLTDVIMLDGGGSFVLDHEGKNVAVTPGSRAIHTVGLY